MELDIFFRGSKTAELKLGPYFRDQQKFPEFWAELENKAEWVTRLNFASIEDLEDTSHYCWIVSQTAWRGLGYNEEVTGRAINKNFTSWFSRAIGCQIEDDPETAHFFFKIWLRSREQNPARYKNVYMSDRSVKKNQLYAYFRSHERKELRQMLELGFN